MQDRIRKPNDRSMAGDLGIVLMHLERAGSTLHSLHGMAALTYADLHGELRAACDAVQAVTTKARRALDPKPRTVVEHLIDGNGIEHSTRWHTPYGSLDAAERAFITAVEAGGYHTAFEDGDNPKLTARLELLDDDDEVVASRTVEATYN